MSTINSIRPLKGVDYNVEQRLYKNTVYDPSTGCLEYSLGVGGSGYGQMNVRGSIFGAHRVMYSWATGKLFFKELDHICRNTRCVAPAHLREVTHLQNSQRQKVRQNRVKGVWEYQRRRKPFWAYIHVNNKRMSLGYFDTELEAATAYDTAALRYHFDPILNNLEAIHE